MAPQRLDSPARLWPGRTGGELQTPVPPPRLPPGAEWMKESATECTHGFPEALSGLIFDPGIVGVHAGCRIPAPQRVLVETGGRAECIRVFSRSNSGRKRKTVSFRNAGGDGIGKWPPSSTTRQSVGDVPPTVAFQCHSRGGSLLNRIGTELLPVAEALFAAQCRSPMPPSGSFGHRDRLQAGIPRPRTQWYGTRTRKCADDRTSFLTTVDSKSIGLRSGTLLRPVESRNH